VLIRISRSLRKHGFMALVKYAISLVRSLIFRRYYQTVVWLKVMVGKSAIYYWWSKSFRQSAHGVYRAVALGDVGYASRSLCFIPDSPGSYHGHLLTADVGDDVVSIIPFNGERFGKRRKICFPKKSAPIFVTGFTTGEVENLNILIGTFNFDVTDMEVENSCIYELQSADILLSEKVEQLQSDQVLKILLCRRGHHGFRAVASYRHLSGTIYLAITDRDQDTVLIGAIPGSDSGIDDLKFQHVSLSNSETPQFEPVGISIIPPFDYDTSPRIAVGQRKSEEISILSQNATGEFKIEQEIAIRGLSRSSIAVSQCREKGCYEMAIALWGGSPNDIDTPHMGELAIIEIDKNGEFLEPKYFTTIHSTDVIAGDFDGDGLDELVVLNYGAGQSAETRTETGNIQIFKYLDGVYKIVSVLNYPSSRIGCVIKTPEGEKDLLFVNLFFEKRLLAIEHIS
jgi:hypothetical protein